MAGGFPRVARKGLERSRKEGDDDMIGAGDHWAVDDDGIRATDTKVVPTTDVRGA